MGLGLRRFSIRLCHWVGRPTKQPCLASNEVWTRCSKFLGADISGLFFFFLRNILRSTRATACPLQNVPAEKNIHLLINCTPHYTDTAHVQVTVILTFEKVIKKNVATDGPLFFTIYSLTRCIQINTDNRDGEKISNDLSKSCSMSGMCMSHALLAVMSLCL